MPLCVWIAIGLVIALMIACYFFLRCIDRHDDRESY